MPETETFFKKCWGIFGGAVKLPMRKKELKQGNHVHGYILGGVRRQLYLNENLSPGAESPVCGKVT